MHEKVAAAVKKANFHLWLTNEDCFPGSVRCKACGETGDFFTMRESICPFEYGPCVECGSEADSNACRVGCLAEVRLEYGPCASCGGREGNPFCTGWCKVQEISR